MSTSNFEVVNSDGWVEIADTNDSEVFIENQGNVPAFISFSGLAPAAGDPGHKLTSKATMTRQMPGKVWVKANTGDGVVNVVVTVVSTMTVNGEFSSDANWTKGTGWTIAAGVAASDGTQGGDSDLTEIVATLPALGKKVVISFTCATRSAGTVRAVAGTTEGVELSAAGSISEELTVVGNQSVSIRADVDFVGTIDNVVVKPV